MAVAFASQCIAADAQLSAGRNVVQERELAFLVAPIKTQADLTEYVEMTRNHHSPLNKISPEKRNHFINSLTCNEKGLTGYNYQDLQDLSVSEAYEVLALFGAQHSAAPVGGGCRRDQ